MGSLKNMAQEMEAKHIELRRITQVASILLSSGISQVCLPRSLTRRCLAEQNSDGGWVAVSDTMWNVYYLSCLDLQAHQKEIINGITFLNAQQNSTGLWGRSKRDMDRVPVTGLLLYLIPTLATPGRLLSFESLWASECNSLTYKAAYALMAFKRHCYQPKNAAIIEQTARWLLTQQRDDGGYAPWKTHPVSSDVYCTAVAALGLLQFSDLIPRYNLEKCFDYLEKTQLPQGIWAFHELEDGASWGLWALKELNQYLQ